jgi:hypothetical protein
VPSLSGFFSPMRTSPSGRGSSRSVESAGRKMYLRHREQRNRRIVNSEIGAS